MANAFQFRSLLGMSQTREEISSQDLTSEPVVNDPVAAQSRGSRSMQVRDNLDVLMNQIEHARRDADQMIEDISALEVEAGQAASLRRENDALRDKLEDTSRETIAEATKAKEAAREIGRLKEDLTRLHADYEKSEREANANALDAERIGDRLRSAVAALNEARREVETLRDAKDKAEIDASCLKANLAERDRTQNALMRQEKDLRMQVAKLTDQNEEVIDALSRKERVVLEKAAEIDAAKDRIAELETNAETSREEIRVLGNKYSELKISQEARIIALNDGLSQERESHRMTLKLLEEARSSNDMLSDENTLFKDQAVNSSRDAQKMKRELSASRAQVQEYGDKLKEAHLRIDSAHSDIQRLEMQLEEAKKDAVTLQRQAGQSDQLLRENTQLHERLGRLQQSLDRRRDTDILSDVPIMLTNASKTSATEAAKTTAKETAAATTTGTAAPNVARIRRR